MSSIHQEIGTVIGKSTTTTTLPDGSQTIVELTRIRNPDGSVTQKSFTRTIVGDPPSLHGVTASPEYQEEAVIIAHDHGGDSVSSISNAETLPLAAPEPDIIEPCSSPDNDNFVMDAKVSTYSTISARDPVASVDSSSEFTPSEPRNQNRAPFAMNIQQPYLQQPDQFQAGIHPFMQSISKSQPLQQYDVHSNTGDLGNLSPQPRATHEEEGGNKNTIVVNTVSRSSFWTRNRKIIASVILILTLGGVAAALGVIFSSKNNDDPSPDNVLCGDCSNGQGNTPSPPTLIPTPTPSLTEPTGKEANEFCAPFIFEIETDVYGNETTWDVRLKKNGSNFPVISGGPYLYGQNNFKESTCLAMGSYEFSIYDWNSDGICCRYGIGKYGIRMGDHVLRDFTNGEFSNEEKIAFNVTADDISDPHAPKPTNSPSQASSDNDDSVVNIDPTHSPTISPSQTSLGQSTMPTTTCSNIKIIIRTDSNTGGVGGDVSTWELIQKETSEVVARGGPLSSNNTYIANECLQDGTYMFRITDSGGDGFGENQDGSYLIYRENILMGGSYVFFAEEEFTFSLPYDGDEFDGDGSSVCSTDFAVGINLDASPQDIYWEVVDDNTGDVVLEGGPYEEAYVVVTSMACLPDGEYTFTLSVGSQGLLYPYYYLLTVEDKPVVDIDHGHDFGSQQVVSFFLGYSNKPSLPTPALSTSPTPMFTRAPTAILSPAPTESLIGKCIDISIAIATDTNTGGSKGDVVTWQLTSEDTGRIILQGGPLGTNKTYNNDQCVTPGVYTFSITDSAKNGFEEDCDNCGYFIFTDDVLVGGSVLVIGYNEKFTFSVPYNEDKYCSEDFVLVVKTDSWPEETTWNLIDASGKELIIGGPYQEPSTIYIHRACLPGGTFEFSIYDAGKDGLVPPGFYLLYTDDQELVDGSAGSGLFGASNTTKFIFGSRNISSQLSPAPSLSPIISLPCINVTVLIETNANTGINEGDVTTWKLVSQVTNEVILSGGPLEPFTQYEHEICASAGMYTIQFADSGGDGFGDDCEVCGYFIYANDIPIGGSNGLYNYEQLTFSIPFYGNAHSQYDWCSDDFWVLIVTDNKPQEISWTLANDDGDSLLTGGPYQENFTLYSQRACLDDGTYTFTIYDAGGDGGGPYMLRSWNTTFVDGSNGTGSFGWSNETTFSLVPYSADKPTQSPTSLGTNRLRSSSPAFAPTKNPITQSPTLTSLAPCTSVLIMVQPDAKTGGVGGDVTTWELIQESTGDIVLSGGPLENEILSRTGACLPAGVYTFNITDSGGDGFGEECEECGYWVFSEDVLGGGGVVFYTNEKFTFSIPFFKDEADEDNFDFCSGDFYVAIFTDVTPSETTWELVDMDGITVLSGGPYYSPFTIYTHMACLPVGNFNFTIYDASGDGISSPGFYFLFAEGNQVVDDGEFGSSKTIVVSLGIFS